MGVLRPQDPVGLLARAITLSGAGGRSLDRGGIVSRTLKGDEHQVGVFAMSRINVPPEALIAHARDIGELKRSSFVTAIQRFSNPPTLTDLDQLVLTARDVEAVERCAAGNCSFKFSAPEMKLLRSLAAPGAPDRHAALQRAFRSCGRESRPILPVGSAARHRHQQIGAVLPGRVFNGTSRDPADAGSPRASDWLRNSPHDTTRVESFLYWSQETFGAGKPVVSVTHVGLIAPDSPGDPAIVLGKQIFSTRYMTGGLSLTAIATEPAKGAHYLVYLNRTGVDLLDGLMGPLKRSVLESRLHSELPNIVQKLRVRLERSARSPG